MSRRAVKSSSTCRLSIPDCLPSVRLTIKDISARSQDLWPYNVRHHEAGNQKIKRTERNAAPLIYAAATQDLKAKQKSIHTPNGIGMGSKN